MLSFDTTFMTSRSPSPDVTSTIAEASGFVDKELPVMRKQSAHVVAAANDAAMSWSGSVVLTKRASLLQQEYRILLQNASRNRSKIE